MAAVEPDEAWFWGTHQGAELDLLMTKDGRRCGVEVKYADAPRATRSMRIARDDLDLHRLTVLYPGDASYDLDDRIRVAPFRDAIRDPRQLFRP